MSLFAELKRRNVIRVGVAYLVLSWLVLQVSDVLVQGLELPTVWSKAVIALLALGFIPVLVFSWIYEMTPEGLKKEAEISPDQSVTAHTAKKLDLVVIVMLVMAGGMYGYVNLVAERGQVSASSADPGQEPAPTAEVDLSIAVLPFVNMSADPENEYFADGLSEELLNRLAQVPELRVAGRTSSFQFKGDNRDLREIGSLLGVAHVLEGSVRRQGDQVRITAQLIDSSDGSHLWSDTYDRTLDDVFVIQDEISERVVDALDIVLDETERQRMLSSGVRDVEAFIAYQRGLHSYLLAHDGTTEMLPELARALVDFDRAIELEPEFSAAYLARSDYFAHVLFEAGFSDEEYATALRSFQESMDHASASAPDPDRRAIVDLDRLLFSDDWTELQPRLQRAFSVGGCVETLWGHELADVADLLQESVHFWQRQMACEPLRTDIRQTIAGNHVDLGQPEEALAIVDEVLELFGDSTSWIHAQEVWALVLLGRSDEALRAAQQLPLDSRYFGLTINVLARIAAGHHADARSVFDDWVARYGDDDIVVLESAAMLGDRELANSIAARFDARPGGPLILLVASSACRCGSAFDLSATPNFAARITEAGLNWPLPSVTEYPAKDW